jgi:hypothetical protein
MAVMFGPLQPTRARVVLDYRPALPNTDAMASSNGMNPDGSPEFPAWRAG